MDRLLALPDVLDAVGVSRSSLYQWVAAGVWVPETRPWSLTSRDVGRY